jgi:hypothetical protein
MEFTKFDMKIIITMTFAIVVMSLVFPPLGLTSADSVDENEIPKFNMSADRFDFSGEFPDRPNAPSQGNLYFNEELQGDSDNVLWLDGDTDNGTEVVLLNDGNLSDPEPEIRVNNWVSGSVSDTTIHNFTQVGDIQVHDDYGYEVQFTYITLENVNESDQTINMQYKVRSQPSDQNWVRRIPILGGVVSSGEQLAGMVGWIGSIVWFFVARATETTLNVIAMLLDIVIFMVDTMVFMITTYGDIVTNATQYAAIMVLIPGLILSVEFMKLIMIGISLLPTT